MDNLLSILVGIYLLISQIMTVVFFIDICKVWDSIIGIIFLGPIWQFSYKGHFNGANYVDVNRLVNLTMDDILAVK